MSRDLHRQPFDDGTKAKLAIFEDYLNSWFGVFFSQPWWKTINIFDFFAGPGTDVSGFQGTPLIILKALEPYLEKIEAKGIKVNLYFNEYDVAKFASLKSVIQSQLQQSQFLSVDFECKDFKDAFPANLHKMKADNCANLLFLDQNGIKQIDEDVFSQIIKLRRTDFLFFISSSTFKRFSDHPYIISQLHLNPEEVKITPYSQIHRYILDYYRSLIPSDIDYYLSSFSLKKQSGIYGLIFGSGHVLGIDKFLHVCWKLDPERGEANFDIDDDRIEPGQYNIFTGTIPKPKKIEVFERELEEKILSGELKNDRQLYLFMVTNSFLPIHVRPVIKRLHEEKKIVQCQLNLSHKICRADAILTEIKVN